MMPKWCHKAASRHNTQHRFGPMLVAYVSKRKVIYLRNTSSLAN
jgi:hypothetical protein